MILPTPSFRLVVPRAQRQTEATTGSSIHPQPRQPAQVDLQRPRARILSRSGARALAPHEKVEALDLLSRPRRAAQKLQARCDARVGGEAAYLHLLAQFGPAEVGDQ